MSKKLILFFIGIVFFFGFNLAYAGVVINEVQIGGSNSNDEFIELYNSDGSEVSLTDWSIKRKTSSGGEYSLVSASRLEGKSISANGYLLLTKEGGYVGSPASDVEWPSSYSLASDNTIFLYDNTNSDPINKVGWGSCIESCISENPTDGKSIQKTSGGWIIASPTPKAENQTSGSGSSPANDSTTNIDTDTTTTETKTKPKVVVISTIKTKISAQTLAFVNIPINFQASGTGYSGEILSYGKYFWNFGDGDSKEVKSNLTDKFTHTYYYPGDYVITLEYYQNYYSENPDATDKITIKVVPADVTISAVGDIKDFFVELTNNSDFNADISKWILSVNGKNFTFPKNTVIQPKKKMIISSKITQFVLEDSKSLKLLLPSGDVAFDYDASIAPAVSDIVAKNTQKKIYAPAEASEEIIPILPAVDSMMPENSTPTSDLSATALESTAGNSRAYLWITSFILLIGVSAGMVYFIRRKTKINPVQEEGSEFDILDE